MVEFTRVELALHRPVLLALNQEYLEWMVAQLREHYGIIAVRAGGQTVGDYAEKSVNDIAAFVPPEGVFYLLGVGGKPAGMGGLRKVRDGVGEIKRMYIRPEYRGRGLGRALLNQLLREARGLGFSKVLLETGKFMSTAQRLYRSVGFVEVPEYPETEVPPEFRCVWLFMEKNIT